MVLSHSVGTLYKKGAIGNSGNFYIGVVDHDGEPGLISTTGSDIFMIAGRIKLSFYLGERVKKINGEKSPLNDPDLKIIGEVKHGGKTATLNDGREIDITPMPGFDVYYQKL